VTPAIGLHHIFDRQASPVLLAALITAAVCGAGAECESGTFIGSDGEGIAAAGRWPNGKIYFFRGNAYVQYDAETDQIDAGFPRLISDGWPGIFADGVDDVAVWPDGKAYFFRGSQYSRWDVAGGSLDAGYPKTIAGNWPGLWSTGVDAVVVGPAGSAKTAWARKAYFFKGSEYIWYDVTNNNVGYPTPIATDWPGLFTASIDAAVVWNSTGKVYFFRGTQYTRYDADLHRADAGYPGPIVPNWGGLTAALWGCIYCPPGTFGSGWIAGTR
jgi:hypothetical protein